MENQIQTIQSNHVTFTVPSGYTYTIREQNGADDDILSNPAEVADLMNISRFIAGIIVDTDYTSSRKITPEEVHKLPVLDKWAILFKSRIHSLGNILEFEYDWGKENGGKVNYEQDLNEYLFDYSQEPTEELINSKPEAIPYYPLGKQYKNIEFTTSKGNILKFDLITTHGENYIAKLPLDKRTKNQALIARGICLNVDGKWEKITNFSMFGVKEMSEIRLKVAAIDPTFRGTTIVENPNYPDERTEISLLAAKDFFFLGEI